MDSRKHITETQSATLKAPIKVSTKTLWSMCRISGFLAVSALLLMLVAPAWAVEREYTTIPTPAGTRSATAFGINARGDIVGSFVDASLVTHGFLLGKNGEFTAIDFPGARATQAFGINPRGDIVGSYSLPGDPVIALRGFLLTKKGDFVNVRYPGHTWERLQRILPDGTILGCYHDYDQMESMRSIVIGKEGASEIDAFSSMANGATPDLRLIVGWWVNMMENQTQGYMIEDGVFTSFMVPGSTGTQAWDVNPDGVIVGFYGAVGNPLSGFVKTGETYETIRHPEMGTTATRVFGINPRGDLVGNYVRGGVARAYLAREVEE